MSLQYLNVGTGSNTGTGTPAKTGAQMINANFDYLLGLINNLTNASKSDTETFTYTGGAAEFDLTGTVDNVDVVLNRVDLIGYENRDFSFDLAVKKVTLTTVPAVGSVVRIRKHTNNSSIPVFLVATIDGQTEFIISDGALGFDLVSNRGILFENVDFTSTPTLLTLIEGVPSGSIIKKRNFY